jgi:hypothetical protein
MRVARSLNISGSYFFPRMFMIPSMSPRQMKAPGAATRNLKGSKDAPSTAIGFSYSVMDPVAMISRNIASADSARV